MSPVPPVLIWLATLLVQIFTGARHVTILAGANLDTEEWYGGKCEWRPIEVEIEGVWYEAKPRPCRRAGS